MEYVCKGCDYTTTYHANYKKHLETKKHKALVDAPHVCKYCDKEFKFRQSMYRHIKYTCKKNKDEDIKELVRLLNKEREDRKDLEKKLETQHKQIEKLAGKLEIHGVNGSFNTTNIQNNITLLPYRETDVSHVTDDDYKRCIKKVNHCVKTLIENIHFNPEKPENMNIYISNMKDKYLMIYDGANWNLANKKDEINRLYEDKEMLLEEWLDTNPDAELKDKFLRYLKNKDIQDCFLKFKEDIQLMLYNGRVLCLEPRE